MGDIFSVIAPMGGGKTLYATCYAISYSNLYPNNHIYANFQLNLPNFHYSPYLFFSYESLGDCLIIADDFYALRNVEGLLGIIVNMSRKLNIDAILTCQYYTMIPPIIRRLSSIVEVNYQKADDILISAIHRGFQIQLFAVMDAVKLCKNIYNTKEVVKFAIESEVLAELQKASKNKRDLEINLQLYTKNKGERRKLLENLSKKKIKRKK